MTKPPDYAERVRAIGAREQTVLIDAGAGAGKTTILVARILALVAPPNDEHGAIPIHRLAAVTFTRRAAGELRLRVRGALLRELGATGLSAVRRERLLVALGGVDGASLGTIHGFADRLLRLQPMKARISPAYGIHEDPEALVQETFEILLHAAQSGTLGAELATRSPTYVAEVERTVQEALRGGVVVYSQERDPIPPKVGLDFLTDAFINHRDRELATEPAGTFDHKAFKRAAKAFLASMIGVDGPSKGARSLGALAKHIEDRLAETDPLALYELVPWIKQRQHLKKKHFEKHPAGVVAWKEFTKDDGHAEALLAPLQSVLAIRLARTRHAIVDLYEQVKTQHQALDTIDLLLTVRNLLRDDLEARAFYQGMFDHILVDELQDTDPLQTEVLLYLAEATPKATTWQDVVVGPGRLTLVGDPKQSIYGFRRADVAMYQLLREQITRGEHVAATLSANFRSTSTLIAWSNHRFADILGTSKAQLFDPATGQVFHQKQVAGSKVGDGPSVHSVPYGFADGAKANVGPARELEAQAAAAYLRWLVDHSDVKVRDPDTGVPRKLRWSDIAVLALVTSNLQALTDQLDVQGVPYAVAGGKLFSSDPLHQQFLLGLRALADRHDGVAEAALLRPPFFAIDLLDLIRDKAEAGDAAAARGAAARAWLRDARRQRFARSPGQTARALLEETGIGRAVALGPNGAQRLRHLRQLCLHLEARAGSAGLDYDGVTAELRDWIQHPPKLDPPRPVGVEALQVLTVHQAKGLEFPVVMLWDGMGKWPPYEAPAPWTVDRKGQAWAMKTHDVKWEEPEDSGMLVRERNYAAAERKRLVYVAATRARDLLVVPVPSWEQDGENFIHARLLENTKPEWVHTAEPFIDGKGAPWSKRLTPPRSDIEDVDDAAITKTWERAREAARAARQEPRSVTSLAKAPPVLRIDDTELESTRPRPKRISRFGALFGDVVHQAIGLVLSRKLAPRSAVERASAIVGLTERLDEATADVERALEALQREQMVGAGAVVRLEYPVAAAEGNKLASGFIDLVSARGGELTVIDFKTDQWPAGMTDVTEAFPAYVKQVRAYGGIVGAHRVGLLFTATGRTEWTR